MSMGGGSSGGTVVGGPSPFAAMVAGQYQSQAAQAAADAAQSAMNDAINAMNRNYAQARYDVQPYRTTGVQALNQLNQYLQLSPYNPGAAPTAPKKYTAADLADQVKASAINQYINQNTGFTSVNKFIHPTYSGYGADDPTAVRNAQGQGGGIGKLNSAGNLVSALSFDKANPLGANMGSTIFGGGNYGDIKGAVRLGLAGEMANDKNATYDTQMEAYNRDLEEYNQNKAWYDQYTAEGPLTQQEISDKITNLPGYQSQLTQGIDAIQKASGAKGLLRSGGTLKALGDYGQNTLATFYGNELDRLASLAGAGQQAATGSAQNSINKGNVLAGLYTGLGDTKANASLASGNAMAQALLAANQQYQVLGQSESGGGLSGIGSILGGIGSMMQYSSKKLKKRIKKAPSTKDILDTVNKLDIDTWQYKGIKRTHIGPYAEDMKSKFGVGDGTKINIIDMLGVLFPSVQELSKQINSLETKLNEGK